MKLVAFYMSALQLMQNHLVGWLHPFLLHVLAQFPVNRESQDDKPIACFQMIREFKQK